MKVLIASVVALLLISIVILAVGPWDPQQPAQTIVQLQCFDVSLSAQKLFGRIKDWILRFYGQSDPNSLLTISRLSQENVPVVNMMKGLPLPAVVDSPGFKQFYAPSQEQKTKPLKFLEYALAEAKKYPDKRFVITFFTDGENDYPADNQALEAICQKLIRQDNIVRIGFFGLKPLDSRNVADWSGWFGTSDKVIIATGEINCTESAIDHLCADVDEEMANIAREEKKGR